MKPESSEKAVVYNPDFSVVDESDDYIVVNKPAHLQIHPSTPNNPPTLWHGLCSLMAYELANGGQVSIINRLDRETSGLVLAAKNRAAARKFSLAMQARRIRKEYLALVWGWPENPEFRMEAPLRRKGEIAASRIWLKQTVDSGGADAVTEFRVRERFEAAAGGRFSMLECRPLTGRMHQIRVHLAHAGYPIVGDKIYGPDESCYLEFIETGWTRALESRLLLSRHALHSSKLQVEFEGMPLRWESPAPREFSLESCGVELLPVTSCRSRHSQGQSV